VEDRTAGLLNGFLGVAIFSGSLPATRVAVLAFDPLFLTVARAAIAGLIGVALLALARQKWPPLRDLAAFTVVALGVVVGFPLLTALALRSITSAHATTFIGLLPLATAIFAVLRSHERPKLPFWLFSIAGSALVAGFALFQGGSGNAVGDSLMIAAILACGLGYQPAAGMSSKPTTSTSLGTAMPRSRRITSIAPIARRSLAPKIASGARALRKSSRAAASPSS